MIGCGMVAGQEPGIRASLSSSDPIWVGQRVTVVVELLAPGYFASAAAFDLPDPAGVILLPPSERPLVSGETVDDTYYSVQRHELSAFATRSGDQEVPPLTVRFRFKRNPLDEEELNASVTTSALAFTVRMPPGAESLGQVISARDLQLSETWQPEPGGTNIPAGAAFVRSITFTAPEVPGMVFPPFPTAPIDGLGIYRQQQLRDQAERGVMRGERRDVITYVCQRPGQFVIPAARFVWFDLESQQLRTNQLSGHTLNVTVNRALATSAADGTESGIGRHRPGPGWWMAGLGLLMAGGWWIRRRPSVRAWPRRWVARFRPVHLAPLNPPPSRKQKAPPRGRGAV